MNYSRIVSAMTMIVFAALLTSPSEAAADSPKLRIVLKDQDPPSTQDTSTAPQEKQRLLKRIVTSRSDIFEWVPAAESHDVQVSFDSYFDDVSESEIWRVVVETEIDAKKRKELHFATLAASEVELKLELQRLHLIKNLSSFKSDEVEVRLTVIGEEVPIYSKGEQFLIEIESSKTGYLNLLNITPNGEIYLLIPTGRDPQRIVANQPIRVPDGENKITVLDPPFGTEYLKAIFSTVPLDLSHLRRSDTGAKDDMDPAALLAWAEKIAPKTRGRASTGGNIIGTAEIQVQTQEKP